MSHIIDFLPQYRELNTLFTNVVSSGIVRYNEQKVITSFYRQHSDIKEFEKMILDIVIEKDKYICILLLSGIKIEVENNIRLYESGKESLNAINTLEVCRKEASRYDYAIKAQLKTVTEYSKELNQINGSLEAMGFREHTPQEETRLWQQHEYQTKRYNEEKEKLTSLYSQQKIAKTETAQYCKKLFGEIYNLSISFFAVLNCYLTSEAPVVELSTEIIEERTEPEPAPTLSIEPDMIFMAKRFEKLLVLEQKLINDKYLSEDLHWVSTHENGKTDIRKLVTFLTALIDNNYFLPNRDPKIKTFFESRYHISIGQNFEKRRREPLIAEYSVIFYDYPF